MTTSSAVPIDDDEYIVFKSGSSKKSWWPSWINKKGQQWYITRNYYITGDTCKWILMSVFLTLLLLTAILCIVIPLSNRSSELQLLNCDESPCEHNGTCYSSDSTDGKCDCSNTGYTGTLCTEVVTSCADLHCQHGARCYVGDKYEEEFLCNCTGTGYRGEVCQIVIDRCSSDNPCMNNGWCVDNGSDLSCDCEGTGYTGSTCDQVASACDSSPCLNDGRCLIEPDASHNYHCDCDGTGYQGTHCENDVEPYVDPCDPPPCLNGGVCSHNGNKFSCDCRPTEYTGPTCNVMSSACLSSPCMNGGQCFVLHDSPHVYQCDCENTGYHGEQCDIKVRWCDSNPCKNNGVCWYNSDTCNCDGTGYEGYHCTEEKKAGYLKQKVIDALQSMLSWLKPT